ncbi:MAG: cation:H+ antiporter [Clostridia bacterium]|nr:cation:H+ antiporter [Clostridia bacterium]MDN5321830.1 cation:H+ antiporter [Clostridia bacterium]
MLIKLIVGLTVILIGAELFTNGVEWLGCRLGLSESAVGSILAAVGTALPESIIPIVAILFSGDVESAHIGIGAILGAPFMLGTLALCITGLSARCFLWRGSGVRSLDVDIRVITRDFIFFILMYGLALAASIIGISFINKIIAFFLVLTYGFYVVNTLKSGQEMADDDLRPLYCYFWGTPGALVILFQVLLSLAAIIWGAGYFVEGIRALANSLEIPSLVLALIIAPIATELPEKFNSIIWISQRKDTLALGNITGAMVFQSSVIPAFGMVFTPWKLNGIALLSGILVICSTLLVITSLLKNKRLNTSLLIFSGIFYLFFVGIVIWGMSANG